jgi:hypothetical protein
VKDPGAENVRVLLRESEDDEECVPAVRVLENVIEFPNVLE